MNIKKTISDLPIAIVTGGGSGIGFSAVKELLKKNFIVCACTGSNTINLENLRNDLENDIRNRLILKKFNINDTEFSKQVVQDIYKQFKRIDVLINSAGIPYGNLFLLAKSSDISDVFQTNYFSLLTFTQFVARIMGRNKKGSIVNISSATSFSADAGTLAYGSAKAALNFATKVLSKELASLGIRVNAVAPGITDTAMLKKMDSNAINKELELSSIKKIATPKEIASVIMFLCSEESSHITGQIIRVDGGK
mgnify:CR=1 FL=1|tara:strand:+ start:454 stop:1209 length:756 start_codon:yes stop_codon:yes gene_type:complete